MTVSDGVEPLHVQQVAYRPDAVVVVVKGEVDISTAAILRDALARAMADTTRQIIMGDLTAVRFLSVAGLRVLLEAAADARGRGVRFGLVACESFVMRVLRMSGVAASIPVYTALSDGMRELAVTDDAADFDSGDPADLG